jgi:CHAT domain-containing protein
MKPARRLALLFGVIGLAAGLTASWSLHRSPGFASARATLATAVGSHLPFDARLSGGFAPPARTRTRSATASSESTLSPDVRITLAEVEKRASTDNSVEAQADLGVAHLIQGNVDRAVRLLEDVAPSSQRSAIWTDLSAAYLLKAERTPDRELQYLAQALESAAQAIRLAPSAEARFNEALALQRLSRFLGESASWETYRSVETDSRWLAFANTLREEAPPIVDPEKSAADRLARLRIALDNADTARVEHIVRESPEAASEFFHQDLLMRWARAHISRDQLATDAAAQTVSRLAAGLTAATGDSLALHESRRLASKGDELATAHIAYIDGVTAYAKNDYATARRLFADALSRFSRAGSDYAGLAEVQLATIAFQERDLEAADRMLTAVERRRYAAPASAVRGRALWMHGLVYVKQWRTGEALAALRDAATIFEQTGQREHSVGVYHQLADTYRTLGEPQSTWEFVGRSLAAQASIRQPVRRYLTYYNATLFTASQDLLEMALRTQSAAVREANRSGNEVAVVESLLQRAALHVRRRDLAAARADIDGATTRIAALPEGPLKEYQRAELAVLVAETEPGTAASGTALERAMQFFERAEPGRVPSLWLALGKGQLAAGATDRAMSTFRTGIDRLETRQARVVDDALKISYFDDSWELFEQVLDIQVRRQQYDDAFATAERSRSRLLRLSVAAKPHEVPQAIADVSRALPERTALVYYATLPERIVIWGISNRGATAIETEIKRTDLGRLLSQHQSALLDGRPSSVNDALYDALITPVNSLLAETSTVVFAPDGLLQQLSFATLRQPQTGRYLVEDFDVLLAPSASSLTRSFAQNSDNASPWSALVMGNPSTVAENLPGSEREAKAIALLYTGASLLTGANATKDQFVNRAPDADVVHFAGHGYANAEYPLLSRLAFSDVDGNEQSLFAHEISRLPFRTTRLVVLSACSTASGAVSRGEGVVGVARPFLGAGVPQVIASLWDVDDHATERLFVAFHRDLAKTRDPVGALRRAQVEMLRSSDPALRTPSAWGAFVVFGTLMPRHNAIAQ